MLEFGRPAVRHSLVRLLAWSVHTAAGRPCQLRGSPLTHIIQFVHGRKGNCDADLYTDFLNSTGLLGDGPGLRGRLDREGYLFIRELLPAPDSSFRTRTSAGQGGRRRLA